jgi:regulatory protein
MTFTPTHATLREAAVAHLARYATTQAGLTRVLDRRVERWARTALAAPEAQSAARQIARIVVAELAAAGLLDDAGFAAARARSLTRSGRSRLAIAAHLAARGVDGAIRDALPQDAETELAAAVILVRRRHFGAFHTGDADDARRQREFAVLARAGFSREIAASALGMAREEAEDRINRLRQP